MRCSVSRCLFVLTLVVGCKKPQVEIEEDGPPAPLSPAEVDRLGQPSPNGGPGGGPGEGPGEPGPMGPGGADEGPLEPLDPLGPAVKAPLDTAGACALVDAYLKAQGRDLTGRQCYGLRPEGAGYRLPTYNLPATPEPTLIWNASPVCLWESDPSPAGSTDGPSGAQPPTNGPPGAESPTDGPAGAEPAGPGETAPSKPGDGYEVAYFDSGSPCRSRDEYCRMGAPGMRLDLSRSACPGDDALGPPNNGMLARLKGTWQAATDREGPSTLEITADGHVTYRDGPFAATGTLRMTRPGNGVVDTAEGGVVVGFAVTSEGPERLYFGPGSAALTLSKDAFITEVVPGQWIRRYRGACYDVTPPADPATPLTQPRQVPCAGDLTVQTTVQVALNTGTISVIQTPVGWLSGTVASGVWRRAN